MKKKLLLILYVLFASISCPLCSTTINNDTLFPVIIKYIEEGKIVMINASGNSMRPFIKNGEKVVLEKSLKYEIDNIVLAHLPNGKYVLHRIYSRSGNIVTLMGDGNIQGEEYCPFDSLKAICRAKFDSIGNEIALDSKEQKNKVIMWKKCIDYRKELLSSFSSIDEDAFWKTLFQYYIIRKGGKVSIRPSFDCRKVNNGTFILFSSESTKIDFSALVTCNETADYVFSQMNGRAFCLNDCVNEVMNAYEIDNATCTKDCIDLLTNWFALGILIVE